MPIEGTCETCGSISYDYGCLTCITQERDNLKQEVARLEHVIIEKPEIKPPISSEAVEQFQRLWEACVGLSEKADFKAILNYAWRLEQEAHSLRDMLEIVLRHKDWLVAMAGLDNSPESPETLRSGLLKLIELAEAAPKK